MTDSVLVHKLCRACRDPLVEILNLGNLRLNAFPSYPWEVDTIPQVPLVLTVCQGCGLVQLDRTVPPDWMYRTYYYRSGVNETMIRELHHIVREAIALVPIYEGDTVLDIGANDGTLLSHYPPFVRRIAVEPALNLHDRLRAHCDLLIGSYFPTELPGPCRIITAIAMSYDLEDPVGFFQAIHDALAPQGVAVVQFQDFAQQLEASAFDNICHEHLEYYTLWSLSHILRRVGLTIQRVAHTPINGGSLRVCLRRQEDRILPDISVALQLLHEAQAHLSTPGIRAGDLHAFDTFRTRVVWAQRQIRSTVQQALDQGQTMDVYGASTKGNILLQILDIGLGQVRQAIDRSPEKVGRFTITGIPIIGEDQARRDPAGVWLSPIWQFRDSVLAREQWYLEQGGTIIFPLPQVEIVRADWTPRVAPQAHV